MYDTKNSLAYTKKAISYSMVHSGAQWNDLTRLRNPTKSKKANLLLSHKQIGDQRPRNAIQCRLSIWIWGVCRSHYDFIREMTALQRFSPEVSNRRTPMEADFLHVHPISNEKVLDVDMPHMHLLLEVLLFCSRRMELWLPCNSRFLIIPYPCDNRK